jgi:hypothetical protein
MLLNEKIQLMNYTRPMASRSLLLETDPNITKPADQL